MNNADDADMHRRQAMDRELSFRPQVSRSATIGTVAHAANGTLRGDAGAVVTGISLDSRSVLPGDLYAAVPGAHVHGARFIAAAVAAGASAVLTDEAGAATATEVPVIVVPDVRAALGRASAAIYGTDHDLPQLFGVTGTNGKTTTTFMISAVLRALGLKTGMIGTIGIAIGEDYIPSTMTTPEATQLHALMGRMHDSGVDAAVMEVSSHSMVYHRTAGLRFAVAGFTNLTQDHLDLHGTMEAYFEAKRALFHSTEAESGVVTIDDEWGVRLAASIDIDHVTLATRGGTDADWFVSDVTAGDRLQTFTLNHRDGRSLRVPVGLPGDFNISNAALALVMLVQAGYALSDIDAAINGEQAPLSQGIPGRMELVNESPRVYVDFAHNPGGLARMLENVRTDAGRIILVFGAAGERDALKRADMGAVAARYADVAIVTDDDPHAEDAGTIRAHVLEGAAGIGTCDVREIYPRVDAIAAAVAMAAVDDIIVVAGRGHETVQEISGALIDMDDRAEVRKAFAAITPAS